MRRQFPRAIGERVEQLGLTTIWAYQHVITPKAVQAAHDAGVEIFAWTVDDLGRMVQLLELGVDGIVSNDPRLFDQAEKAAAGGAPKPEPVEGDIVEELDEEAEPAEEERPESREKPKPRPKRTSKG